MSFGILPHFPKATGRPHGDSRKELIHEGNPGWDNHHRKIKTPPLMTKYSEEEIDDFQTLYQEIAKIIIRESHPLNPEHPSRLQITQLENALDFFVAKNHGFGQSLYKIVSNAYALIETIKDPTDPIWKENPHPFINP
jgi:hypothetical protein